MTDTDLLQVVAAALKEQLSFFVPSAMDVDGGHANFTTTFMDSGLNTHLVEVYVQIREIGTVSVTLYGGPRLEIQQRLRYGQEPRKPARWPMAAMTEEIPLADPDCIDRLGEYCRKWIKILGR